MKILAVRIKNLASLEGETIIDFAVEPLQSAGIFAITGPTGAGKSTVLDALCLALYAQTPRYNKSTDPNQAIHDISGNTITQSDVRGILRDGTAEGWAEVDFIGVDGQRYRSRWSVRRGRNKADGTLQAYQVACKNLDTNTDVQGTKPEILASITKKVGLSFDQFTRTVLLAQGDFTAFLKAPNNEKSDLLEKLTGTQIYSEISKRVFEHHRQEKEELEILLVQKQGINILSDEELEMLNKRRTELANIQQEQQKNEAALAKELSWHEQLNSLLEKLAQSTSDYDSALVAKKEARQREEKLQQVEQVQPARILVQSLTNNRKHLTDKEISQKDLDTQIHALQEQRRGHEETLKTAQQNLDLAIKTQETAQPLLNKAKELDVQLNERAGQKITADTELIQAREALDTHHKQVTAQQQKARELQLTIEKLTAFVEKHKTRQTLAENHKLVLTGLADAHRLLKEEQQASANIQAIENTFKTKQQEEKRQEKIMTLARNTMSTLAEAHEQLQKAISGTNISNLQKDIGDVDALVIEIIQASADWKTLFEATRTYENNKIALQRNKNDLEANQTKLMKAMKDFETTQALKDAAARALDIAKLAAAKDVVTLRKNLSEGAACPVCGSTEHPYAEHDPRLNEVLDKLETEFRQQELKHNEALKEQSAFREKVNQLEKETSTLSEDQVIREREITECRKNWARFFLHAEAENLPSEEVTDWLKQELAKQQTRQKKLKEQHDTLQKQQQELDKHRKQYDQAVEQYRAAEDRLKDIQRDLKSLLERLEQAKKDQYKILKNLAATQTTLAPYFTNADWFENWKADEDTFTQGISSFAIEWNTKTEKLNNAQHEHGVLAATIQGLENQQQSFKAEVIKKEQAASNLKQQYDALLNERKKVFDGKAIREVEQQLKTAIDKAQEELEQRKAAQERIQTDITSTTARQGEMQKEIQRLSEEIKDLDLKLIQWLSTYNAGNSFPLNPKDLETLLAHAPEWIQSERLATQQINTALVQAETVMNEHKTSLKRYREQQLSERAMETVAELLAAVKSNLQEMVQEDVEVNIRIRQDADNRVRMGALLQQIEAKEKVTDNWAKLNMVIGSADGKKFRQVAQEYTLDVLLEYTNVQLGMLTKRYILQRIPGSLGLQVIDQDMGNEVRTVNSLSGGESFLVSLALALGLASLSSSHMQVESLFIDEGFGALDPTTLSIAMDALERLHNQGRKVGVISHVQEMTERIPVQIKVSKQQNGRSKVEILQ
jgi:ATPase involved in DNA repair